MVASIEHILKTWKDSDQRGVLTVYFADGVSNGERVANLFAAFERAGIVVERDVFDDYLAIKYLRNVIVHADEFKDYQKEWLKQRGFPVDPRRLGSDHWRRMRWVNENMMWYLFQIFLPGSDKKVEPLPAGHSPEDFPPVLSKHDIARVFWRNLEWISERLSRAFEAATASGAVPASWTKKEEWWAALWRQSRANPVLFGKEREHADVALFSWSEYFRLTFEGMTISGLDRSIRVLRQLHERRTGEGPLLLPPNLPADAEYGLLRAQVPNLERLDRQELLEALKLGEELHEGLRNITPCYLFAVQLPIVEPGRWAAFATPAGDAIRAMEAGQLWKGLFDLMPDLSALSVLRSFNESCAPRV
jgi:hypothetical protein